MHYPRRVQQMNRVSCSFFGKTGEKIETTISFFLQTGIIKHRDSFAKQQDKNNSTLACWLSFLVDSWTVDSSNGCL
jgi:hypothetical protein